MKLTSLFFSSALLLFGVGASAAAAKRKASSVKKNKKNLKIDTMTFDSKYDEGVKRNLLAKAERIDTPSSSQKDPRQLEDAFYYSYISSMSVVYYQCFNRTKMNENGKEGFKSMVHFALCPTVNCTMQGSGCIGDTYGEYLIRMDYFVDAYMEAKLEDAEFKCEMMRERCGCDGQYNDDCLFYCYEKYFDSDDPTKQFDWSYCSENENQNQNADARYGECERLEIDDDDYNNYYYNNNNNRDRDRDLSSAVSQRRLGDDDGDQEYSVGPYCASDHKSVYLMIYKDDECIIPAADDGGVEIYDYLTGGSKDAMPYSAQSGDTLITSQCMSCKEPSEYDYNKNNNNYYYNANDQNDADEIIQFCEETFLLIVSKCEDKMEDLQVWYSYNQDDDGGDVELRCQCDCLDEVLQMEGLSHFTPYPNHTLLEDLFDIKGWFESDEGFKKYVTPQSAAITGITLAGIIALSCLAYCCCYCCSSEESDGCCYNTVADDDIVDDKRQSLNPDPQPMDEMDDSPYVYS